MDTIEHLEFLSKLKFEEEEKQKFEKDFKTIVDFVGEIQQLELPDDLNGDEPVELSSLREDEPRESMPREEVLANAPKQKDGCYVTPLVVE